MANVFAPAICYVAMSLCRYVGCTLKPVANDDISPTPEGPGYATDRELRVCSRQTASAAQQGPPPDTRTTAKIVWSLSSSLTPPSMIYEVLDHSPVKHAIYVDDFCGNAETVASDAPADGVLRPLLRMTADWPKYAPEARVRWCPAKCDVDCLATASSSDSASPPRTGGATPPVCSM